MRLLRDDNFCLVDSFRLRLLRDVDAHCLCRLTFAASLAFNRYFLQISFCVMLSADFAVTIPFTLADALPTEENTAPPSYWVCGPGSLLS